MSLTILNQKALSEVNETYLRMCDPEELRLIVDKVSTVNKTGNRGYMKNNDNMRFRGDMPSDFFWKVIAKFPKGSPERAHAKKLFFKQFPKLATDSKSKYV
jgi:hypothetical protein